MRCVGQQKASLPCPTALPRPPEVVEGWERAAQFQQLPCAADAQREAAEAGGGAQGGHNAGVQAADLTIPRWLLATVELKVHQAVQQKADPTALPTHATG